MLQLDVPIIAHAPLPGGYEHVTLGAPTLATRVQPGQVLGIRPTFSSIDPLVRTPLAVANANVESGTVTLVVTEKQRWGRMRVGDVLDVLGPVGSAWTIPADVRNLLLVGTAEHAAALHFLANVALKRALNVTLLLGAQPDSTAFPTALIPPAVEYQFARGDDPARAALDLIDSDLMRWADAIYTTVPLAAYEAFAARIRAIRLRWTHGFAQGLLLAPMACYVGICDACVLPSIRRSWRACVDGPACDLRDFVR